LPACRFVLAFLQNASDPLSAKKIYEFFIWSKPFDSQVALNWDLISSIGQ
jgi:hypothetical protein